MMFLRFILSLGETGALLVSKGSAGRAYGDGSCLPGGLVMAAPEEVGNGSVGSASEWKGGSARCPLNAGADWGSEW